MTDRLISFSRDFKQQYDELTKQEQSSVDDTLSSMTPVLKTMKASGFHFNRVEVRFAVKAVGMLHVPIHDNPLRAIVKKIDAFRF